MTNRRVLLVEEDRLSRQAVAEVLMEEGYVVTPAAGGWEALACLERDVPELVLVDLGIDDMDPAELLARLRATAPGVPVIVLTADLPLDAERRWRRLGADGHLNKPFGLEELLRRVVAALPERWMGLSQPPVQQVA